MSPRRRRGDISSYNGPRFRQDFWKKVRKELPTLSLYILCKLYSNDNTPKRSKQRRDDMPPPMAFRFKNRGGSIRPSVDGSAVPTSLVAGGG